MSKYPEWTIHCNWSDSELSSPLFSAMEEYDATYDSDDEVDFSKMDMVRERSAWLPEKQSGEISSMLFGHVCHS